MISTRDILSVLLLLNMIPESSTFLKIVPISKPSSIPQLYQSLPASIRYRNHHILCAHNSSLKSNMIKTNITNKVYKMNYENEDPYEELFKPRYAFGLNEYNMILIRIYVYIFLTIYFIALYLEKYTY